MKNRKNKKGFTLTELIIVIVIIGILAAVLIPSLSSYVKKAKVSKGVQNARNLSTIIVTEAILDDEEFLMPNDVIALAKKNGYDLVSEVEGYSYWYDSSTNMIKFEDTAEATSTSISAAVTYERSRPESLSEVNPKWFYIDQTDNAIHQAIETINNLVDLALEDTNNTNVKNFEITNQTTYDTIGDILNTMNTIQTDAVDAISSIKGIDATTRNSIIEYLKTFNTSDTIYYSDYGVINQKLYETVKINGGTITNSSVGFSSDEYGGVNALSFKHAMVVDDTKEIPHMTNYTSIAIAVESPLIIPSSVNTIGEQALKNIVDATVLVTSNSNPYVDQIGYTGKNSNVTISSLASLVSIDYLTLDYTLNYANKAYRFNNGLTFTVSAEGGLKIDNKGVIYTKDGVNYTPYKKQSVDSNFEYLTYMEKADVSGNGYTATTDTNNKWTTYVNGADTYKVYDSNNQVYYVSSSELGNLVTSGDSKNEADLIKVLICEYLVPTIKVDAKNLTNFVSSSGVVNSNITLSTSVKPFSTSFTGVLVNSNNIGCKVSNIGYITDLYYDTYQLREVTNKVGTNEFTSYTMYLNNQADITISLPTEAQSFVNFEDVTVKVTYRETYNEYKLFTLVADSNIYNPTGVVYKSSNTKTVTLEKNDNDYIKHVSLSGSTFTNAGTTYTANQIEIEMIEVYGKVNGKTTQLFVRYINQD